MALSGDDRPLLIGFADALAAPEAALSLVAAGFRVAAFARAGARPALRRHPLIDVHEIAAPEDDAPRAVRELRALAARIGARALMPLDDAAVWLCDAAAPDGTPDGLPVIGPTGEQARLALDKARQLEAARTAGLPVPATTVLADARDALDLDAFPLVLKPALALSVEGGRLRRGSGRVCASRAELVAAVEGWTMPGPILAQPFVPGTGEGLFGLVRDGRAGAFSAHRRLRMVNPQGSGSSACVSIAPDPELGAAAARMLEAAGWDGLFMVELLRDRAGTPWFMELNGRTWGSLALARRLGLEYPAWAAAGALGLGAPAPSAAPAVGDGLVCRHLGREILHTVSVLRGPRSEALTEWPSRWRTLRDVARVRRGERWYNWSSRHPAMFLDDTLQTVLSVLPRPRAGRR